MGKMYAETLRLAHASWSHWCRRVSMGVFSLWEVQAKYVP